MPSVLTRVKELSSKFLKGAPKNRQDQIQKVLDLYAQKANLSFTTVQNMVVALYSPSLIGKTKADKMYENFISKYSNSETDYRRGMTWKEKHQEREDRRTGTKQKYQINVILYTQKRRLDGKKAEEYTEEDKKIKLSAKTKKFAGLVQVDTRDLQVQAYRSKVFEDLKWKLVKRGTKEFRALYPIMMTNPDFRDREKMVPGYLDAIYIKDWTYIGGLKRGGETPADPVETKKRSGEKVAIAFKYCSHQIDAFKPSFKEAIRVSSHAPSECWINTLYDNFKDKLLRPDKTKNLITRKKILDVLGRTEDDIKDGLTIREILPFFQKYKLKLRVYDVFYNLIFKHYPETPNFNNPALYCLTDGDHIYTLNKELDSLAQKHISDEHQLFACPNFHIPEKPASKANYRVVEHIDQILEILREEQGEEERTVYLIHKTDNLEAIVWQLYDAGYRPNLQYGIGKLSWVSLSVNQTRFVFRSQQLIDWAIDGGMEVHDAQVFNRMHDAKTEFHYQLFKSEHKSYYDQQDLEVLDECRTVANVGWLKRAVSKSSLVEIDISKAYTGAFMRITAVPVFNEFDVWTPYEGEPIRNLSLYTVEAHEFDLFFNKRFNLVYGHFLKQLPSLPAIKAVKHPSVVKKVDYAKLVSELFSTKISDDKEEDQTLKKTIANCSYGVLEKQVSKKVKSRIFDSYEEAKFFQLKYGGEITFVKQYEQTSRRSLLDAWPRRRRPNFRSGPDGQLPFYPQLVR